MIDSVILGFGYKMRSGKDSAVAAILGAHKGECDVRRYAFADALKMEVNAAAVAAGGMENLFKPNRNFVMSKGYYINFPAWVKFDPHAPMDDPLCPLGKQRELLQFWGLEYKRREDPDYWVKQLAKRIEAENPAVALVTDVRFSNEVDFCKEYGEVIRVDRPGFRTKATHKSETSLDGMLDSEWSLIIENSGTLGELQSKAVAAFDILMASFPYGYGAGVPWL